MKQSQQMVKHRDKEIRRVEDRTEEGAEVIPHV